MPKLRLTVVGLNYRGWNKEGKTILKGKLPLNLKLVREPDNDYDPKAVAIFLENPVSKKLPTQVGYLDRRVAEEFQPVMDAGELNVRSAKLVEVHVREGVGKMELSFSRTAKAGKGLSKRKPAGKRKG